MSGAALTSRPVAAAQRLLRRLFMQHPAPLDPQDVPRLLRSMRRVSTAVLTTRAADGSLTSRPMLPLAIHAGRELLFLTNWSSCKVAELGDNPSVNVILMAAHQ